VHDGAPPGFEAENLKDGPVLIDKFLENAQEIDVDASSASAKDGLLTIILPKLDKMRQTKLRVKAG